MVGYKGSLSDFKIEIILSIFNDWNGMKLEINNRKKMKKFKYMEINQNTYEQPVCQRAHQNKNRILRQVKNEKQHSTSKI